MPRNYQMTWDPAISPAALGAGIVVAEGDSITLGFGSVKWTDLFHTANPPVTIFNVAAVSQEVGADMIGQGASQVDTKYGGSTWNACVLWGGTNDMANSGQHTAAETYGYVQTWCQDRRAAHASWIIVVLNCMRRSNLNETTRNSFNSMLAADHSFANILIDIATPMGDWVSNPSYWQSDHTHITAAGEAVVSQAVEMALRVYLS